MTADKTIGSVLAEARKALTEAGIDSPALDARLLVATALGVPVTQVIAWPERAVAPAAAAALEALVQRRLAREPMSQILGHREFWSLDFAVTRDTLTPRADTETLVSAVLEQFVDRAQPRLVLDLGTGTGCLLIALLAEWPEASGIGVDRSEAALAVARRNAAALGVGARARFLRLDWTQTDWPAAIGARCDVVVSNPPYIVTAELAGLPPEVRHEPVLALDGGADGLAAYRALAPGLARALEPDGIVGLEIGAGQAPAVEAILRGAGLEPVGRRADLAGIDRCILARPGR